MKNITMREAIKTALAEEMRRDPSVFLLGEDIGAYGGTLQLTAGLYDEFGGARVIDTPLSEVAIAGAAIGAALMGMRPVMVPDIIMPDDEMRAKAWKILHDLKQVSELL